MSETSSISTVARMRRYFALEREIVLVSGAMLLLGFGENLWKKFVPKYLEALGAPIPAIGLYGSIHDFIDAVYQYPGGWLSDRLGRRRALLLLIGAATAGYAVYMLAPTWSVIYAGLVLVMAWQSMASPTLFAIVGDTLPREQRAMGFTVQSILRRVPIAVAPVLGGLLISRLGVSGGIRAATAITIVAAIATLLVARLLPVAANLGEPLTIRGVWKTFSGPLRRLLLSDIFIRTCEGLVDVFLVLYAVNVVGISAPRFGLLIGVQMLTAIATYIPAARFSDRYRRKPFIIATFVAFAVFPLAVVFARSFPMLSLAYIIAGLRELGEPSRKALIIDLAQAELRGRTVGLYYLIRSVAIAPAATVGGLLWRFSPPWPFYVAAAAGAVGTIIFALTTSETETSQ